ncbi:hypothetical protein AB1Y20_013156 [Prymnesium parvum]|uniref:AB hydrolase-1 domain-containing protein n=1 Tax=Prymnesium parvum TaxID=97485 RepID=A0AB34IJU8_PRYPA
MALLQFTALLAALSPPPLSVRTATFDGVRYSATVLPATSPGLPPLLLLPPIGVGIDRSFCDRFLSAWAAHASYGAAVHAIDVIGMGDSAPKPSMRRPWGGYATPPRTPAAWAAQLLSYIRSELHEACVLVAQSNLCAVALEAAAREPGALRALVLVGPPAVEALSADKSAAAIAKVWRLTSSPVGAALFRFARRKAFLASFSKQNLFADPSQVDEAYLEMCAKGAEDTATRHAVFSFVAGTWRRDYRPVLASLRIPTLIVSGRDVRARGSAPKPRVSEVDKTSLRGLLRWFRVWGKGDDQPSGRFDQVGRDLGLDPEEKLRDYVAAMPAAEAAGCVETALLPGFNVLVYESPRELAECIGEFVSRRCAS